MWECPEHCIGLNRLCVAHLLKHVNNVAMNSKSKQNTDRHTGRMSDMLRQVNECMDETHIKYFCVYINKQTYNIHAELKNVVF